MSQQLHSYHINQPPSPAQLMMATTRALWVKPRRQSLKVMVRGQVKVAIASYTILNTILFAYVASEEGKKKVKSFCLRGRGDGGDPGATRRRVSFLMLLLLLLPTQPLSCEAGGQRRAGGLGDARCVLWVLRCGS